MERRAQRSPGKGRVPCFEMGGDFSSLPWLPGHWDSAVLRKAPLRLRRSSSTSSWRSVARSSWRVFSCGEADVVTDDGSGYSW